MNKVINGVFSSERVRKRFHRGERLVLVTSSLLLSKRHNSAGRKLFGSQGIWPLDKTSYAREPFGKRLVIKGTDLYVNKLRTGTF